MPAGSAVRNRSETVTVVTPRGEVEVAQGDARPEPRQLLDVVLARAKKGHQRVERDVDRTRGIRRAILLSPGKLPAWLNEAAAEAERELTAAETEDRTTQSPGPSEPPAVDESE